MRNKINIYSIALMTASTSVSSGMDYMEDDLWWIDDQPQQEINNVIAGDDTSWYEEFFGDLPSSINKRKQLELEDARLMQKRKIEKNTQPSILLQISDFAKNDKPWGLLTPPKYVWHMIFDYLSYQDILNFGSASKYALNLRRAFPVIQIDMTRSPFKNDEVSAFNELKNFYAVPKHLSIRHHTTKDLQKESNSIFNLFLARNLQLKSLKLTFNKDNPDAFATITLESLPSSIEKLELININANLTFLEEYFSVIKSSFKNLEHLVLRSNMSLFIKSAKYVDLYMKTLEPNEQLNNIITLDLAGFKSDDLLKNINETNFPQLKSFACSSPGRSKYVLTLLNSNQSLKKLTLLSHSYIKQTDSKESLPKGLLKRIKNLTNKNTKFSFRGFRDSFVGFLENKDYTTQWSGLIKTKYLWFRILGILSSKDRGRFALTCKNGLALIRSLPSLYLDMNHFPSINSKSDFEKITTIYTRVTHLSLKEPTTAVLKVLENEKKWVANLRSMTIISPKVEQIDQIPSSLKRVHLVHTGKNGTLESMFQKCNARIPNLKHLMVSANNIINDTVFSEPFKSLKTLHFMGILLPDKVLNDINKNTFPVLKELLLGYAASRPLERHTINGFTNQGILNLLDQNPSLSKLTIINHGFKKSLNNEILPLRFVKAIRKKLPTTMEFVQSCFSDKQGLCVGCIKKYSQKK